MKDHFNIGQHVSRLEAANILGVSVHTLAVWASTKRYPLPFYKVGRKVLYRVSDLNHFIEQNVQCGGVKEGV